MSRAGGVIRCFTKRQSGTIHEAAERGDLDTVKAIAKQQHEERGFSEVNSLQAKDDLMGATLLHFAAENNHRHVVEYLFQMGVFPNPGDQHMVTPMHLTAIKGHVDMMKLLLQHGADACMCDTMKDTPLHWAAVKGCLQTSELLLEAGADVHAVNTQGWTPLHRAANSGSPELVEWLCTKGASVHAQNRDGDTPLHLACAALSFECVDRLLLWGAHPAQKNAKQLVPGEVAPKTVNMHKYIQDVLAEIRGGPAAVPGRALNASLHVDAREIRSQIAPT